MTDPQPKRPNRTTLEIPPPLRARLNALAERTGRKRTQLILEALEQYLDRREPEQP
jgi:predicted transcriptional regulator